MIKFNRTGIFCQEKNEWRGHFGENNFAGKIEQDLKKDLDIWIWKWYNVV
jgi:hypothetical protein